MSEDQRYNHTVHQEELGRQLRTIESLGSSYLSELTRANFLKFRLGLWFDEDGSENLNITFLKHVSFMALLGCFGVVICKIAFHFKEKKLLRDFNFQELREYLL